MSRPSSHSLLIPAWPGISLGCPSFDRYTLLLVITGFVATFTACGTGFGVVGWKARLTGWNAFTNLRNVIIDSIIHFHVILCVVVRS
jgi:hypothetical protein